MNKAILVMDMPLGCNTRKLRACDENDGDYCPPLGVEQVYEYMRLGVRAGICPLIPAIGYIEAKGNMVSWEDDSDENNRNKAKRVTQESDDGYFVCPSCLRAVDAYADFCSNCGQRLDWEDEE